MLNSIAKKLSNAVFRNVTDFSNDQSGVFIPTVAVSALAIMLSAGIAVDYSQISRAQTIMDNSLDAAILATGNSILDGEQSKAKLRKVFEEYLYSNLASRPDIGDVTTIQGFDVNISTGEIDASLKAPVNMAFMGLVGKPVVDVSSIGQAVFSTNSIEISMVLDVTGSMLQAGRMGSLKRAAKEAVDILLPANKNNSRTKIGLVPYASGVNLPELEAAKASKQSSTTCMTERQNFKHSDTNYHIEPVGADSRARCSRSKLRPLTADSTVLKRDISKFVAGGATAGHLGIAWGYYMLSENWQDLWPAASKPNEYGSKTQKVAIIMTDGNFNTYFNGVSQPYGGQAAKSNLDAKALCAHMKKPKSGANGIIIYSIAFKAPNPAKNTLRNCASKGSGSKPKFFDASNEKELTGAFKAIAQDIKSLRLAR